MTNRIRTALEFIDENTFAAACYNQNSIADLEQALVDGPDATDLNEWGIDGEEYMEQIKLALAAKREDNMAIGTGVVSRWELNFTDTNGNKTVRNLHSWDEATTAFRSAVSKGAVSAIVYAVSGRGGSRKISTWEFNI